MSILKFLSLGTPDSFVHSFVCPSVVRSFVTSSVRSFARSFIHKFAHLYIQPLNHSLPRHTRIHPIICSPIIVCRRS